MLQCISFILKFVTDFIKMLFSVIVDRSSNISYGLLLCISFIVLPIVLRIINFLKQYATDVLVDEFYEETKTHKRNKRRRG